MRRFKEVTINKLYGSQEMMLDCINRSSYVDDIRFYLDAPVPHIIEYTIVGVDTLRVFNNKTRTWVTTPVAGNISIFEDRDGNPMVIEYEKYSFSEWTVNTYNQFRNEFELDYCSSWDKAVQELHAFEQNYPDYTMPKGYVLRRGVPCIFHEDENIWEPDWDFVEFIDNMESAKEMCELSVNYEDIISTFDEEDTSCLYSDEPLAYDKDGYFYTRDGERLELERDIKYGYFTVCDPDTGELIDESTLKGISPLKAAIDTVVDLAFEVYNAAVPGAVMTTDQRLELSRAVDVLHTFVSGYYTMEKFN